MSEYSVRTLNVHDDVEVSETTGAQVADMGTPRDLGKIIGLSDILDDGWTIKEIWPVAPGPSRASWQRVFLFER